MRLGRDGIGDDWGESNRAMVLVIERPERKNPNKIIGIIVFLEP